MLKLNDGRSELWQWDTGRKITVDADCSQVHFSNRALGRSLDADVVDGVALIPDVLLQSASNLSVWGFVGTPDDGYTKFSKVFRVNARNKPSDYVFTPQDQTTLENVLDRLNAIEQSAANGEFDGTDGITPHIGGNGNWYIGETDTGVRAQGKKGEPGDNYILTEEDKKDIAELSDEVLIVTINDSTDDAVASHSASEINAARRDGKFVVLRYASNFYMMKSGGLATFERTEITDFGILSVEYTVAEDKTVQGTIKSADPLIVKATAFENDTSVADRTPDEIRAAAQKNMAVFLAANGATFSYHPAGVNDYPGAAVFYSVMFDPDAENGIVLLYAIVLPDKTIKAISSAYTPPVSLGVSGASVGQIAKITEVDENGVPTAWESVDPGEIAKPQLQVIISLESETEGVASHSPLEILKAVVDGRNVVAIGALGGVIAPLIFVDEFAATFAFSMTEGGKTGIFAITIDGDKKTSLFTENYRVETDITLTEPDAPADAKVTGEKISELSEAIVTHTAQTLTDEQQAQARANIGAATVEDVLSALSIAEGVKY